MLTYCMLAPNSLPICWLKALASSRLINTAHSTLVMAAYRGAAQLYPAFVHASGTTTRTRPLHEPARHMFLVVPPSLAVRARKPRLLSKYHAQIK